jgi:hypothetical protein
MLAKAERTESMIDVLAVVGLVVAIATPASQRWVERRDRIKEDLRKARALALLLRPTLEHWHRLVVSINDAGFDPEDSDRNFLRAVVSTKALETPRNLLDRVESLYVLGRVADHLYQAMLEAHEGQAISKTVTEREYHPENEQEDGRGADKVRAKLRCVQAQLEKALDEIVEIIPASGSERLKRLVGTRRQSGDGDPPATGFR